MESEAREEEELFRRFCTISDGEWNHEISNPKNKSTIQSVLKHKKNNLFCLTRFDKF